MALPFGGFVAIHVVIGVVVLVLSILVFALSYCYFPNMYIFFNERIFGIKLTYNPVNKGTNEKVQPTNAVGRFLITIGHREVTARFDCGNNCCLTFVGGVTLALALMVLFEGCILASAGLYPGDSCPDDPMTCFVFDNTTTSGPVSAFDCAPGNISLIPSNASNAWCYGWVVKRNTVSRVINQIGICGGIIGVLGTLFAFMFQAHMIISLVAAIIAIIMFPVMIGVSSSFHIAFSVLAYIVCANCIIIGCTGCMFNTNEWEREEDLLKSKQNHVDPANNRAVTITTAPASSNKITPIST